MSHKPPALAKRLLQWFCHAEFIEEVEGDLDELIQERVKNQGLFKANLLYLIDVLNSTNLYRSKPRGKTLSHPLSMRDQLNHFFKIALRNMVRSRTSTLINLCGLAISLASFLFIALYIIDETTYDSFHPDADNVYRISYSFKSFDGNEGKDARAAGLWSVRLNEIMPEVKQITRFSRFGYPGNVWSGSPDNVFVETQFFWVDSTFSDIFSLQLVNSGDVKKILADPHHVIINESTARKYFGAEDPLGKIITYARDGMDFQFTVSAIMKDFPSNSHFKPDFIANCTALNPLWIQNNGDRINSWTDSFSYSFINVKADTDLSKVSETLRQIFKDNITWDNLPTPVLIPLRDIHFTTGLLFELEAPGDKTHLYIFGSIGLLIIGMACINYMNLATARSIRRSKEVGLRKTLGVSKITLIIQFIGESLLMTVLALLLALVLVTLFLPSFNDLTLKNFSVLSILQGKSLYPLIATVFTVGIFAGSYPAFYLSSFRPVEVLKGKQVADRGAENFRKILVVFQITITLLLLTGTYAVHDQLVFIDRMKLSEFKDQIITVRLGSVAIDKVPLYKRLARQDPHIQEISVGPHFPRRENFGNMQRSLNFQQLEKENLSWDQADVDFDFPSMFQLEFLAGRNFSFGNPADTSSIILNEAAVKELGITPEKALGLQAEDIAYYERNGEMVPVKTKHNVIGVVADFSYASVRKAIEPLVISGQSKGAEMMYIKMQGNEFPKIIDGLMNSWKQIYPATPFQFWFMDEEFGRLYQMERQMAEVFMYLAFIAMLIACLGLFGLASFTAEQKTKQIGIRKVLGASSLQVLVMLTSRYVRLTLISFVIGIPISFIAIRSWMETFVYKAQIETWIYFWTCLLIISITVITVGVESLRAARANPADSIRHE